MNALLKVSLRQKAIFIPADVQQKNGQHFDDALVLASNLSKLGYGVSEDLLNALKYTQPNYQKAILATFEQVMGVNKNWTPLVKAWNTPTGEGWTDHFITHLYNLWGITHDSAQLACGHNIPYGTFPLERYNGCPFCGTPFEAGKLKLLNQGSKLKVLDVWQISDAERFLTDLLTSKTALDATQMDSLQLLLTELPVGDTKIAIKETLMAVIDTYIANGAPDKAQRLFTSPTDILRYLWYKHTGFLQIIEPKTIVSRLARNNKNIIKPLNKGAQAQLEAKAALKLKYSRTQCAMVAKWLNDLSISAGITIEQQCEAMHPKREMWVRFIRALRLAEYSKRPGMEALKQLLDVFYNKQYDVWQGRVDHFRLRNDSAQTFALLKQRPGLFARSLFATMLWFGPDDAILEFAQVAHKVPARLLFTLNMYADFYFDRSSTRVVKPLGGTSKSIGPNNWVLAYTDEQLDHCKALVIELCLLLAGQRFASVANSNKSMYIDPTLFTIPMAIGDRSETVHDIPSALMGTRFEVQGSTVRLFMQWGTGLPSQHLDMDLSCIVLYEKKQERCFFGQLVVTGCKHSGDIQRIPNQIGTAEYINIDVSALQKVHAQYVVFTSNAYTNGSLSPNMVVGWMDSSYPMRVSDKTGVAYDPSCVQHQVRIVNSLSKGLVFGVLDVQKNEIIWLELPFGGQLAHGLSLDTMNAMLKKLASKLSVGQLLQIKAKAQNLQLLDTPNADEVYTKQWVQNTAAVTQLLVD